MSEKNTLLTRYRSLNALQKAEFFASAVLLVLIIACAVIYSVSAISIYTSADTAPYSRDAVMLHLSRTAPISYVTLAVALISGVLSLFNKKKRLSELPLTHKAEVRINERTLGDMQGKNYLKVKENEKKRRRKLAVLLFAISSVISLSSLLFLLNPNRYSIENINTDIAYSVVIAGVAMLLMLTLVYIYMHFSAKSYLRLLNAANERIATLKEAGTLAKPAPRTESNQKKHALFIVRCTLILLAIFFIALGVADGGMREVFGKAIRICTECIGIG